MVASPETLETTRSIWLHADAIAQLPDNALTFAQTGGSLLAAILDGSIDVACSGALAAVPIAVERPSSHDDASGRNVRPQHVAIPLDINVYKFDADGRVPIDRRMQLLSSMNVGAVTSGGAACEAHGGSGATPLASALDSGFAVVGLRYSKWDSLVGSVALSNLRLVDGPTLQYGLDASETREDRSRVLNSISHTEVPVDETTETQFATAAEHFRAYVEKAAELRRTERVYDKSPFLSKSFTSATTGYTSIDAIIDNNSGLDADQLESVLAAHGTAACDGNGEMVAQMLRETVVPGLAASEWRLEAARAIHLAIRTATDYHVDGVATTHADGRVHFEVAESWLLEVQRDFLKDVNDCDGSCALAARMVRQIGLSPYGDHRYDLSTGEFASLDPTFDPKAHPWTRAIRNALSHTDTFAFTIVGATSGEGTQVSTEPGAAPPPVTAQGHAVAMLLPSGALLEALGRGDPLNTPSSVNHARFAALFPRAKVLALPPHEQTAYANTGALLARERAHAKALEMRIALERQRVEDVGADADADARLHLEARIDELRWARDLAPLSVDGTVTSEMHIHSSGPARRHAKSLADQESAAAARLGSVMASRVIDLTSSSTNEGHAFYLDFVEATIPHAFGDSSFLRSTGHAAYQFVFAPVGADDRAVDGAAGATPEAVHNARYALVPLGSLDVAHGASFDLIHQQTKLHTLAPRDPKTTASHIGEFERRNATTSLQILRDLDAELRSRGDANGAREKSGGTYIELHMSPRMMWGNPSSIALTAEKIKSIAVQGQVDLHRMDAVTPGAVLAVIGLIVDV